MSKPIIWRFTTSKISKCLALNKLENYGKKCKSVQICYFAEWIFFITPDIFFCIKWNFKLTEFNQMYFVFEPNPCCDFYAIENDSGLLHFKIPQK